MIRVYVIHVPEDYLFFDRLAEQARANVPEELVGATVIDWNWPEIARFIRSLDKSSSASA